MLLKSLNNLFKKRGNERLFGAPPPVYAVPKHFRVYSDLLRPFGESERLSIVFVALSVAPIDRLLASRSPSAIAFFIISVVVSSVYLEFWGISFGHVIYKGINAVPFTANRYAPAAIPGESFVERIVATRHYAAPHIKKRVPPFPMCCNLFYMKASTALCVPASEMVYANERRVFPAIASAKRHISIWFFCLSVRRQHGVPAVPVANTNKSCFPSIKVIFWFHFAISKLGLFHFKENSIMCSGLSK